MADTPITTSENTAVQMELYAKKSWLWAQQDLYIGPMIAKVGRQPKGQIKPDISNVRASKGYDGLITMDDRLRREKGQTVNMNILKPLSGAGRANSQRMKDHEEKLQYYGYSVTIGYRKNAVVMDAWSEQKTFKDLREDGAVAVSGWLTQIVDTDSVLCLSGVGNGVYDDDETELMAASAPTTNRKWFGGQTVTDVLTTETTVALLGNDDGTDYANYLFGPRVIEAVHRKAKTAGSGYSKIRPIRVKGKNYYIMFVHPLQVKALKASAAWQTAVTRALYPVPEHPMFEDAVGNWDGVIIKEWDKIETRLGASDNPETSYFESGDPANATYTVTVARALFCGCQAAVCCVGSNVRFFEDKDDDYGDRYGVKTGLMYAFGKPQFNSEDYGVIVVNTCVEPDE